MLLLEDWLVPARASQARLRRIPAPKCASPKRIFGERDSSHASRRCRRTFQNDVCDAPGKRRALSFELYPRRFEFPANAFLLRAHFVLRRAARVLKHLRALSQNCLTCLFLLRKNSRARLLQRILVGLNLSFCGRLYRRGLFARLDDSRVALRHGALDRLEKTGAQKPIEKEKKNDGWNRLKEEPAELLQNLHRTLLRLPHFLRGFSRNLAVRRRPRHSITHRKAQNYRIPLLPRQRECGSSVMREPMPCRRVIVSKNMNASAFLRMRRENTALTKLTVLLAALVLLRVDAN